MKISIIHIVRIPFVLALLHVYTYAFAQQKQEVFTITNYFTERYRDFPMMKISIVPPEGFVKDTDQVGFLDLKNSSAIRAEIRKQNIDSSLQDFSRLFDNTGTNDSLGLKLLESYHFKINGYEAELVNVSGNIIGEEYLQWWIFIGNSSETYIVKSYIPSRKKKLLEQQVRSALLSVFFEPERRLIPIGVDPTTTGTSSCNCHKQ